MDNKDDYIELVKKAQLGDEKSMNHLAELSRGHLRAYIYRLTLDEDLTQDILQESMLEMLKFLNKLERVDRFWPWLFRIAGNNLRDHWDHQRLQKTKLMSKRPDVDSADKQQGFENLVGQELKQIVSAAILSLKPRHRKVLILRCYEEMTYSEISEVMACSEFAARRLFYRAKKTLAKQLSRSGIGKGSLIMALCLFGKMTASSEAMAAQVSVTAAATEGGLLMGLAALTTNKTAIVSLTAAGILTAGTITITSTPDKATVAGNQDTTKSTQTVNPSAQMVNGVKEYWYYFPEGPGRPMMMRVKLGDGNKQNRSQFLHNDRSNYHYYKNTVHINNNRMYTDDLSILRLPTDSPELTGFISQVEGRKMQMQYVPNKDRGLLIISTRNDPQNLDNYRVEHHPNVLDERYFLPDWPTDARVIDNRDAMHMRGWTYFRISGWLNGQPVSGTGQIPFVYATSKRYRPWLKLQIGSSIKIIDNGTAACVFDANGEALAQYAGGSFFKGLGRPWMGLHTIDTVRRDAAEKRVSFETKKIPGDSKVEVVLTYEQARLVYTIDMETDVIERITFSTVGGDKAELQFSYLQNIDNTDSEFTRPGTKSYRRLQQSPPGMLWLVKLIKSRW